MAARGITDRSNHTSSRRRPEPITTWVWRGRDRGPSVVQPGPSCLWVPAQGRDDNGVCCSIRISNIREDAPPRSRGMMYPRCGVAVCSSRRRGRRESRVRAAPAVSCAKCASRKRTRAYRFSGNTPAFPARWVTAYFALSPVTGLFCHRRLARRIPRSLAPASGRQDHTTSPSATSHVRPT
jgi:hypothetical protein